ncbi:MAG: entericidin A/B family lipoprotein [Burkholderiales bacterium]|jgi:predicted small secreted protein|nr:entericidin A/B family lipoprotein [Burkholderiales bacterium]
MKRLMLITVIMMMLGVVAGCNTVQGIGKDIQAGGETIEKAAK